MLLPLINNLATAAPTAGQFVISTGTVVLVSADPIPPKTDHSVLFRFRRNFQTVGQSWRILYQKPSNRVEAEEFSVYRKTYPLTAVLPVGGQPYFMLWQKSGVPLQTEQFVGVLSTTDVVSQQGTSPPTPGQPFNLLWWQSTRQKAEAETDFRVSNQQALHSLRIFSTVTVGAFTYEVPNLAGAEWQEPWRLPSGSSLFPFRQIAAAVSGPGQPFNLLWPKGGFRPELNVEQFAGMLSTSLVVDQHGIAPPAGPPQPFNLLYWASTRQQMGPEVDFRVPDQQILHQFRWNFTANLEGFGYEVLTLTEDYWLDPQVRSKDYGLYPFRQGAGLAQIGQPWSLLWPRTKVSVLQEEYSSSRNYRYPFPRGNLALTLNVVNGVYTLNGYNVTLSGSGGFALHGKVIKTVYVVSPTGKTKWVDYLPVKINFPTSDQINRYNDLGALGIHTLSSTSGLVAWEDYIPIVIVGTTDAKKWRYDDDGHLPVVEVIDP